MVIVGARSDDDVSLPLANLAYDLFADFQGRQELAVVVIKHLVFDADASARF
jgi:hypothetical protein